MPFRSPLERRVGLIVLVISLALAEPMLGFDARAAVDPPSATADAGEASSDADLTWGTGLDETTGRAARVRTIVVVGRKVYLGGDFTAMVPPGSSGPAPAGSVKRAYLAALDVDKHTLAPWDPDADGPVYALALASDGTKLYVGGDFDRIGGASAPKLARIDVATGKVDPTFTPGITGRVKALALAIAVPGDGSRIFVAGSFLEFAGRSGLVVLDGTTGAAVPEQYTIKRPLFDLDVWPADNETVFASAGGSGGHIYAFHADQPGKPLWSTWVDGDAPGVAASETDVYLMGHYDYAGPQKKLRRHLAAFDADSGAVEDWNPVANTPQGAFSGAVGADHVFVGGEFTQINGRSQPGFAQFDLAPAPTSTTTATTTGTSPRRRPAHPGSRPRLRPSRATMSG